MQIIDGREIAKKIKEKIKIEIAKLGFVPVFCDVLVGDDLSSIKYVEMKKKSAEEVGIKFIDANIPNNANTQTVIEKINELSNVENMAGIIVQLPLPGNLDKQEILDAVPTNLDVDSISTESKNNFYNDNSELSFPTALAILEIIKESGIDLENKKIVILGEGELVGKPIKHLLQKQNLDVESLNSTSENSEEKIKNADVIITAIGKAHYIHSSMVKNGVFIIDAGTSESNGAVVGDVDTNSFTEKDATLVPCPGGVGPVTVAMLLNNILLSALKNKN